MGKTDSLVLYTAQTKRVIDALLRDGVVYSHPGFIKSKYQESAKVFLAAYDWFVSQLPQYVSKPEGAVYPYWAFPEISSLEAGGDRILKLLVPKSEVVLFDRDEWTSVLRLDYLGESRAFREHLKLMGVKQVSDVSLTSFYPSERLEIEQSWERLFRHNDILKAEEITGMVVQAGLWCLKSEWIIE